MDWPGYLADMDAWMQKVHTSVNSAVQDALTLLRRRTKKTREFVLMAGVIERHMRGDTRQSTHGVTACKQDIWAAVDAASKKPKPKPRPC